MALLGDLVVKLGLDSTNMTRGLNTAKSKVSRFVAGLGVRLKSLAVNFVKVGAAATAAFAVFATGFAIKKASELEETMNKFNVVFGDSARATKQWGDEFAKQVGRSREQIASFLAGTQDLLVPAGLDPGSALAMSKSLTQLAVDVASFNKKLDSDVLRDFHAALTGGGETVKKYGVLISVATTNAELLRQGINPKEATEAQKVFARFNVLLAGTTAAQGDAIRSAGSFANQMKRLRGSTDDLAATVGTSLLPLFTAVVSKVAGMVEWFEKNEQATGDFGEAMTSAFEFVGKSLGFAADLFDIIRVAGVGAFTAIAGALHTLIGSVEMSLRAVEELFNGLAKIGDNSTMNAALRVVAPNLANITQASSAAFGGELDLGSDVVGELRKQALGGAVSGANDVEATLTRMNEKLSSTRVQEFFDEVRRGAENTTNNINKMGSSLGGLAGAAGDGASLISDSVSKEQQKLQRMAEQFQNKLKSRAQRIFEITRTDTEKFESNIAEINDLLGRGLISADTASRARRMEKQSLIDSMRPDGKSDEKSSGAGGPRLGAATTRGSREAYSTIANASLRRAMTPSQVAAREKARAEAAKKQREQALEVHRQALKYMENLSRNSDANKYGETTTRIAR